MVESFGSSNVLCTEREGRGEMPSRLSRCDGASQAEEAFSLRLAIWICSLAHDH